jgi:hypothetical protein
MLVGCMTLSSPRTWPSWPCSTPKQASCRFHYSPAGGPSRPHGSLEYPIPKPLCSPPSVASADQSPDLLLPGSFLWRLTVDQRKLLAKIWDIFGCRLSSSLCRDFVLKVSSRLHEHTPRLKSHQNVRHSKPETLYPKH